MPHARNYTLAAALGLAALLLVPEAVPLAHAQLPGTTVHVVQAGETLWQIADRFGVDANTLVRLNNLDDPDLLSIGQSLTVPGTSTGSSSTQWVGLAVPAPTRTGKSHTVVAGDTLWAIALQFGTTPASLVDANSLDDPDQLSVGMELTIPGSSAPQPAPAAPTRAATDSPAPAPAPAPAPSVRSSSYTVQQGDTLNKIARQFDVTGAAIALANGMDDPNRLPVGTMLTIPTTGREHVVRVGETLRDIAAHEKVDLGALIDFNNIDDPELIRVGQVVRVPASPSQTSPAQSAADSRPSTLLAASAPRPPAPAAPAPAPKPAAPIPQPAAPAAPAPAGANPRAAAPAPALGAPIEGMATYALRFLGTRYVFGGSSPGGFDCSGLVWYVARQQGKPIARGMLGQYNGGAHPSKEQLKPGDMVFFQNTYMPGVSHNGFYVGNGKFVHAADERSGVTVSDLSSPYWASRWFGATRLS